MPSRFRTLRDDNVAAPLLAEQRLVDRRNHGRDFCPSRMRSLDERARISERCAENRHAFVKYSVNLLTQARGPQRGSWIAVRNAETPPERVQEPLRRRDIRGRFLWRCDEKVDGERSICESLDSSNRPENLLGRKATGSK